MVAGGTPEGTTNWQGREVSTRWAEARNHPWKVEGLTSKGQAQHHPGGLNHILTEWKHHGTICAGQQTSGSPRSSRYPAALVLA